MGLELEEGLRTLSVGQLNIHGTPGAVSKAEASDSAGGSECSLRSALPARCTEAAGPRRPGLPGRYPVGFRSVFVFPEAMMGAVRVTLYDPLSGLNNKLRLV